MELRRFKKGEHNSKNMTNIYRLMIGYLWSSAKKKVFFIVWVINFSPSKM